MDTKYVENSHVAGLKFVFSANAEPQAAPNLSPLLAKMIELPVEIIQQALGKIGVNLHRFAGSVDLTHPDLACFAGGIFLDGSTTAKKFCQIIDAWILAKEKELTEVLPLYRRMAKQECPASFLHLRSPQDSKQVVRLVSDYVMRKKIRDDKNVRIISLHSFFRKGEPAWHIQPADFDLFIPGSKSYEQHIFDARKKAAQYKNVGCGDMEKAVLESIKTFEHTFQSNEYYGFYQITATNVAIILAKLHGYTFQSPARNNDARMIKIPDQYNCYFKEEEREMPEGDSERRLIEELQRMVEEVSAKSSGLSSPKPSSSKSKKAKAMPCGFDKSLVYAPTIYPLDVFLKTMYGDAKPSLFQVNIGHDSLDVLKLVERLESCPQFNGKPMFDHFLVLVPSPQPIRWSAAETVSIKTPKKCIVKKGENKDEEKYIVMNGETVNVFNDPIRAKVCLDEILISKKLVTPVLLGERDGKCYFLSFWN